MIAKNIVESLIEEYSSGKDIYPVDLKISGDNKISVEIDSYAGVSLDDCVALNRYIESKLDRDAEDYELEVSSAGLTEPFKVLRQYKKNIGKEIEVLQSDGKKVSGILVEAGEQDFKIEAEKSVKPEGAKRKVIVKEEIVFTYQDIKTTKLIIRFK